MWGFTTKPNLSLQQSALLLFIGQKTRPQSVGFGKGATVREPGVNFPSAQTRWSAAAHRLSLGAPGRWAGRSGGRVPMRPPPSPLLATPGAAGQAGAGGRGLGRGGSRAVLAAAGGEEEAARLGRRAGHVLADYRPLGAAGPRAR